MKTNSIKKMAWAALLLLGGCASEDPTTAEDHASLEVRVTARTGETVTHIDKTTQTAKLYLGSRMTENDGESVHFISEQDITANYTLTGLRPYWYRMAFVCAPTEGVTFTDTNSTPGKPFEDFNQLKLDYNGMQSNSNQTGADWESIYRKVQDRWLQIGPNMEDVVLTRINGQLKLNMGVLPNQFATKVTQITVKLTQVPRYVYVRDNANDEVYTEEATTYTYRFTPDPSVYWDQGENAPEYILYFNLLPFTLDATGRTVAVTEVGGTTHTYPLTGDSKPIAIGKNKRTTVHFNGIDQAFFEVRYAGFDDTGIDVDGDEWDGWQDSPATTNP